MPPERDEREPDPGEVEADDRLVTDLAAGAEPPTDDRVAGLLAAWRDDARAPQSGWIEDPSSASGWRWVEDLAAAPGDEVPPRPDGSWCEDRDPAELTDDDGVE